MQNRQAQIKEDILAVFVINDGEEGHPGSFVKVELEEVVLTTITCGYE